MTTARKTPIVSVKLEDVYAEGSYTALVSVYGLEFALSYVAGEIRVRGFADNQSRRAKWQVTGAAKAAREFAAHRIAQQGPSFAEAHAQLYAD